MDRINTSTAGENVNGEGKRGFRDENLAESIQATRLNARWFNNVQEEILSLIEDAGIEPDGTQQAQLLSAINAKIQNAIGADSIAGILTSRTRSASARPDFLRAGGNRNTARVLASQTDPLTLASGGVTNLIQAEVPLESLPASPASNNTAQFAFTHITDLTALTGEVGTVEDQAFKHGEIPLARAGSEITGRVGKDAAFKISLGRVTEYFYGKIESASLLTNVQRRYFLNPEGDAFGSVEGAIRTIGNITMVELLHVIRDLTNNEFLTIPSTKITESDAVPGSPSNDDLWRNTSTGVWSRYGNGQFNEVKIARCGYLVMDGTNCVAAKSLDVAQTYSNANDIEIGVRDDAALKMINLEAFVSVYGAGHRYDFEALWGASNLEAGVSIEASSKYFLYVTERGTRVISDKAPQYIKALRGYYHPLESWRCVGEASTDASSDFTTAVNHFLWERYALHGAIPEVTRFFDTNASAGGGVSINDVFVESRTRTGAGAYRYQWKDGLFESVPWVDGSAISPPNQGFTYFSNLNASARTFAIELNRHDAVRIDGQVSIQAGFTGSQLKQVRTDNSLKRLG